MSNQIQRIRYQRTSNAFHIQSEGNRYVMPTNTWNKFLNRHGNQPDSNMESRHGLMNVDREAFNKMLYTRQVNTTINVEIVELIKTLSKGITDINYDAPADDYLKQVSEKIEQLQKRLSFFQHNFENHDNLNKKVSRKLLIDFTV